MAEYQPPLDDINFTLNHIAGLEEVSKLNGFQHADPTTVAGLLEEAARFFSEVIAPLNRIGDTQGSVLTEDGVKTPDGFKEAYLKYVEAGWHGAHLPEEWGGGGLPYTVGIVIQEMFKTANMAFSLCPMLTSSGVEAILHHGSTDIKETFLENMVTGQWTGTMCLTEPEAGSDVGALRTRAEPAGDGTYRLFGTKIFITWGDHDLTENTIHLVLARTPGAAPGTKGISMFVVPKYLLNPDGSVGAMNDVKIVSLEHKLGIHASPTCVVSLGDSGDGAIAYLLGEEQEGMANMFTMMNLARVGVGIEGLAIGEGAYQQAVTFARERLQGRPIGAPATEKVPIIEHPDVRRMLLTMRAHNEAMRSLLYLTARYGDEERHGETEEIRRFSGERVALLTPIVKAWCTDIGVEMASLGIQVHGGMGYIEETGAAQYYRDARIAPIYEGTNGIQAIDLVLRKLPLGDGEVLRGLLSEIEETAAELKGKDSLTGFSTNLSEAVEATAEVSAWLGARLAEGDLQSALAGATPYLRLMGTIIGGWLMGKGALAAAASLDAGTADTKFLNGRIVTARFYGEQILPTALGLVGAVTAGPELLDTATF